MKILTLQGSPRKKGNTAKVLAWVEEELASSNHNVESVFLNSKNLKGCLACAKCKTKPDVIACIQNDDIFQILEKMTQSDLIIFASPLYFWGVSSQLKTVFDRTYSLYVDYHKPTHASLIENKREALILTGAGGFENNAEEACTAFSRMQKPHKTINAGKLYIGSCSTPDKLDESIKKKAIAFANKITE